MEIVSLLEDIKNLLSCIAFFCIVRWLTNIVDVLVWFRRRTKKENEVN